MGKNEPICTATYMKQKARSANLAEKMGKINIAFS